MKIKQIVFISLSGKSHPKTEMAFEQKREELDAKARQGETVVPGGTGGKSLEAQENLAEGIYSLCLCVSGVKSFKSFAVEYVEYSW